MTITHPKRHNTIDTYSLVSDVIPCRELDTVHLKGIGPVRTFQPIQNIDDSGALLSLEVGTSSLSADLDSLTTDELATLQTSLEAALEQLKTHNAE